MTELLDVMTTLFDRCHHTVREAKERLEQIKVRENLLSVWD